MSKQASADIDLSEFITPRAYRLRIDVVLEDELEDEQAQKLRAALERRDITANKIADVVKGWGISVGPDSVRKWRRANA